jgi:hypothetical protein
MCEVFRFSQGGFALLFDETASFSAPTAFGSYRVLHQTGIGVLGPVFRASDPRHDRLVAVKTLRLDILPEQVVRLADALRRLTSAPPVHPALVSLIEVGSKAPRLLGDFQAGETRRVALRRRAGGDRRGAAILSRLAELVDAMRPWVLATVLHHHDVFVARTARYSAWPASALSRRSRRGLTGPMRRPYVAPDVQARGMAGGLYSSARSHELFTGRRPALPVSRTCDLGDLAHGCARSAAPWRHSPGARPSPPVQTHLSRRSKRPAEEVRPRCPCQRPASCFP